MTVDPTGSKRHEDGGDPTLTVSTEAGIGLDLQEELRAALEDQWRLVLVREDGAPALGEMECRIVAAAGPIERRILDGKLLLKIPAEAVRAVLGLFDSFRHGNALVAIPTLLALLRADAFPEPGEEKAPSNLADFARRAVQGDWETRFGRIWGAFHCLALQGWIELEGVYDQTTYRLTPTGGETVALVRGHRRLFGSILEALPLLAGLHTHLRLRRPDPRIVARYRALVDAALAGWPLAASSSAGSTAARDLRRLLDSLVLAPTLVAVAMPVFRQMGERIDAVEPGLLDCSAPPAEVDLGKTPAVDAPGRELLGPAFELLAAHGLVRSASRPGRHHVTPAGARTLRYSAPVGALAGSYARSYARLDEHLFDPTSRMGIADDDHVDRLMNVFGTSLAS
ncbi:MAG: hypothetical protein PVI57_18255, partial [Gemmatimonadota bacterium]